MLGPGGCRRESHGLGTRFWRRRCWWNVTAKNQHRNLRRRSRRQLRWRRHRRPHGGTFGWSALVEPNLATLSAHTTKPCKLVAIDGQKLRQLLEDDLSMGYQVMTKLAALVARKLRALSMSIQSNVPSQT